MSFIGRQSTIDVDAAATHVRVWSVEEFRASREAWDDLLRESDADPLFMSWDWQWRWWMHHCQGLQATLRLAAVYEGGRLIGLAPFYSHVVRVRGVLRARRLELIGIAWRNARAMFSDYPDIIVAHGQRRSVLRAIEAWLAAESFWDEIALCCVKREGAAAQLAVERLSAWTLVRGVDEMTGWRARLPQAFDDYLQGLSPNARRRLFHQRRKLIAPCMEHVPQADIPEMLRRLWQFSAMRWGSGAPSVLVEKFQIEMAGYFAGTGELRMSRLMSAQEILSILYCVRRGATVYYLQSGFDPARGKGLSPGLLHFGYAIEAACKEGAEWFDFLAGTGRSRDYKRDLLTETVPVVSYHVVRGALRRTLYEVYERAHRRRNPLQVT